VRRVVNPLDPAHTLRSHRGFVACSCESCPRSGGAFCWGVRADFIDVTDVSAFSVACNERDTHDRAACRGDRRSPGDSKYRTSRLCSPDGQDRPSDLLVRRSSDRFRQSADACATQFDRRHPALKGLLGHIRSSSRVFAADPLPPDEHGPSEELRPGPCRSRAASYNTRRVSPSRRGYDEWPTHAHLRWPLNQTGCRGNHVHG
jgi:hypothetical protein